MGNVYWSEIAQRDLENIGNFIARDSTYYAIEFIENLTHNTRQLIYHLKIGRVVPEFDEENLRELVYHNYRIVYEILDDNIYIITVCHASMDIVNKAKKEGWKIN